MYHLFLSVQRIAKAAESFIRVLVMMLVIFRFRVLLFRRFRRFNSITRIKAQHFWSSTFYVAAIAAAAAATV